jgi:hypothetical protein
MKATREGIKVLVLQIVQRRSVVRVAIHPQQEQEQEPYHLPHQARWFVVMLIGLLLLLGKTVAAAQCVIA